MSDTLDFIDNLIEEAKANIAYLKKRLKEMNPELYEKVYGRQMDACTQ